MTSSHSTRKKIAPFGRESANVFALVFLYSVLISLWSLSVGYRVSPSSTERNEVEDAAILMASELQQIAVPSKHFGLIGLADQVTKNGLTISSANVVSANLRNSGAVASTYDLKHMQKFVQEDLADLEHVKSELCKALKLSLQPNYYTDFADSTRRSLYERAYKIITERSAGSGRVLVDLKIQLGTMRSPTLSLVPAVRLAEESLPYDDGKFYKTGMVVPVPRAGFVQFYDLGDQVKLTNINEYEPVKDDELGSVVKVDATFESTIKEGFQKLISRESACARIGAPVRTRPVSALLLSFPAGSITPISCLEDLLRTNFTRRPGDWHQAVDAAVPGGGHLAPPLGLDTTEAPCDKAIQMALYHWFLTLGANLNPANFTKAAAVRWDNQPIQGTPTTLTINSAVVRDTGAPQFSLLYQSKPGGQGQQALAGAFSAAPAELPRSAIPLLVDGNGNCNLPGRKGVDLALVKQFLDELHRTNVAAIESRSIAHTVFVRMREAIETSSSKIAAWRNELSDLERSIAASGEKQKMMARKTVLTEKIQAEERNKTESEAVKTVAARAESNSSRAADETFAIASELRKYCENGLNRVSGKVTGYLLNKSELFVPHPEALSEEDLYEVSRNETNPKTWTSEAFMIKDVADAQAQVDGLPIVEFWKKPDEVAKPKMMFALISSVEVSAKGNGAVQSLLASPFTTAGLPKSQLLFYSADAVRTGSNPSVKWSCLIRDLVAFREKDSGEPIPVAGGKWKEELGGPAPGLACEIQIRSPIPVIPDLPGGYSALNPSTKESVNLIPPMPAEML